LVKTHWREGNCSSKRFIRGAAASLAVFLLLGAIPAMAAEAAVGPQGSRSAVMALHPERAVLLAAAPAGHHIVAVGERGIIILSDDAGRTWHQVDSPVSVTLTAVDFVNESVGYAVGHSGVVLATEDGGRSWSKRFDGLQAAQVALESARGNGDAAQVQSAERLVKDGADKPFLDLHFFDATHGIVVGAYNLIFATEDGGRSWAPWMSRLDNPKGLHLYALRVQGTTILIAGEQGIVLRSIDNGKTFVRLDTGYKGSFFTAELSNGGEIVVAGLRGNALRSMDAGATWQAIPSVAPVSWTSSAMRPDGEIVLANQEGSIFAERNGSLSKVADSLPPINGLAWADGALLALTVAGAMPVQAKPPGVAQ
jgi:photosystem II stability/assembly factor-like uncharacterized protein